MLLEKELKKGACRKGCSYTILRPVFIYDPYNYAPRESWYIQRIVKGQVIPHPSDANGKFQMVYVKDVARALIECIRDTSSIKYINHKLNSVQQLAERIAEALTIHNTSVYLCMLMPFLYSTFFLKHNKCIKVPGEISTLRQERHRRS